mgnify:CR=1 FL=1
MPHSAPAPAPAASPSGTPLDASLLRIVAQGLVPATSTPDVAEAVRRQLAIQGQQVSAVPHALLSRTTGTVMADVEEAFAQGRLVRSWPMRGTVHITAAEDHHWLRQALEHRMDGWRREDEELYGQGPAALDRAARIALEAVAAARRDGRAGASRTELVEAWRRDGFLAERLAAGMPENHAKRHLVVALHVVGVLVQGPRCGNEHLIVDATDLPGAETGPGGSGGCARGTDGHRAALAEIARRYATSHGPVSAADLARWTTLPVRECAQALEDAVEITTAAGYSAELPDASARGFVALTRARAQEGRRPGVVVSPAPAAAARGRAATLYMRADLPDLLADSLRQARSTLFLASFDELHVGYRDRSCLTDEAGERLICPGSNGMFRPLLVDRGRVVAVRPTREGLIWAPSARRSARLETDVERAVRTMERRLGR